MSKRVARSLRQLARISLALITLVLAFLVVTTIYQGVMTVKERSRFPAPGRLIDVGGYRLHLLCAGQGSPTVVLESGGGMSSIEWTLVQPEVAKFTRVCSYDRAGYGWSDSDSGRQADTIETLHVLLRNGAIYSPYVIVGHSYGSGLARRYAYRFENEVRGMVLAATSFPDEEVQRIAAERSKQDAGYLAVYAWTTRLGLLRVTPERFLPEMARIYFNYLRNYLPPKAAECEIAFLHQAKHVQAMLSEREHSTPEEESEDAAACRRGFGNMPLVVLCEKWIYWPPASAQEKEEARREDERQMKLARLSSRGEKIDLDSGHLIPLESPAAVVDAIRHVVLTARGMP